MTLHMERGPEPYVEDQNSNSELDDGLANRVIYNLQRLKAFRREISRQYPEGAYLLDDTVALEQELAIRGKIALSQEVEVEPPVGTRALR